MATDIMSLFQTPQDNRQSLFQQSLGQALTPQQFVATLGTQMGSQLAGGARSLFGQQTDQEKIAQIMQQAGKYSDPMSQAQEAYKMFQQQGMVKEAQMMLERMRSLQAEGVDTRYKEAQIKKMEADAIAAGQAKEAKAPTTRQYYKGNDTVYEQWDPDTKTWVEYGRAPRTVGGQKPDMIQQLEYQARRLKCDIEDPVCYAKAEEAIVNLKRGDASAGQILVNTVKKLDEDLKEARTNATRVKRIDKAFDILTGANGMPITGSFADTRTGILKIGKLFGISESKAVQATEALKSNNMGLAGELLASGMFGAGTGISDRDMATALQMAGADTSLTYEGMIRILENLRADALDKIKTYNNDINGLSDDFFKKTSYNRQRYLIDVPQERQGPRKINTGKPLDKMTPEELKAAAEKGNT